MKTLRTFSIDGEFIERLKEEGNQSELINRLLGEYFKQRDLDGMTKKQIEAELAINRLQKETDKKIKEMRKNAV